MNPDHVDFLKARARDYYETDEFIFVHASYDANKPMSQQSNTTLQWEFVQPDRMRMHDSGQTVVAGHTPQTDGEPLDLGFLKVIDTDVARGGWLTALEVRSGRILQANQHGETRGEDEFRSDPCGLRPGDSAAEREDAARSGSRRPGLLAPGIRRPPIRHATVFPPRLTGPSSVVARTGARHGSSRATSGPKGIRI